MSVAATCNPSFKTSLRNASWNLRFRLAEQSNLVFEFGNGTQAGRLSLLILINRCSESAVVMLGNLSRCDLETINQKSSGRFGMPSRNESERARARLQLETPISDEMNLLKLQEQVADCVREAKRRDPSEPDELVSRGIKTVARDYFRIRKTTAVRARLSSVSLRNW